MGMRSLLLRALVPPPSVARRYRPAREVAGIASLYGLITLWWLWPLPRLAATHADIGAQSFMKGADYYLIVWVLAWGARTLVRGPWDVFHANTFYPSTSSLAYSEHLLGYQPLFAPVYWITDNGVLAANVLIVLVQILSAAAMYTLARRFVGPPAAFVGGFFYAFLPARYFGLAHLHLLGVQYLPLAVLVGERWFESARTRDGMVLAVVLTLQVLSSMYLAYATMLLLAAYVPCAGWHWRGRMNRRRLVGFGAAVVVAMVAVGVTSVPYLRLRDLGLIPSYADRPSFGIWAAPAMVRRYLGEDGIGPLGYILALVAMVPGREGWRWPRTIALAAVIGGVLVASGPVLPLGSYRLPTPYEWLVAVVPGFSSVRVPSRLAVVATLGLALLAALGLDRIGRRVGSAGAWGLAAVVALGSIATWQLPPHEVRPQPVGSEVPPAYRWLRDHGRQRPVLELPQTSAVGEARRMFLSTVHWLPIVGGYSGYPPRTADHVRMLARGLPGEDALQAIVDTVDIGWILVHTRELPAARTWRRTLPSGLTLAASWPDATLFEVTRGGDTLRRSRLLSPHQTPGGVALVPLGPSCPGRIRVVRGPAVVAAPGRRVVVRVAIHNDGAAPWPALGFVPNGLVQLRVCIGPRRHAAPCRSDVHTLPADVWPYHPVTMDVPLRLTTGAHGPQQARLELVQTGAEPLVRCGVEPVTVDFDIDGPP